MAASDGKTRSLLGRSALLTGARLVGACAGFLTQIFLARNLSPGELGIFYGASSLAVVASVAAAGGYPSVAQRFITRHRERGRPDRAAAFIAQMKASTAKASLAIALMLLAAIAIWPAAAETRATFAMGVLAMLAMASINICLALAVAERQFAAALLPDNFFRPILVLCGLVLIAHFGSPISLPLAMGLFAGLTILIAAAQAVAVSNPFSSATKMSPHPRLQQKWASEALPLIPLVLFTNLFADIVIVLATPFLSAPDLAAFGVCVKISMLVAFVVQVAHQVSLPDIALAHERGDSVLMRATLLRAAFAPSIVTFLAVLTAALWGDRLLGFFGPRFSDAKWSLVAMLGAQFIRSVAGPSTLVLTLRGAQLMNSAVCIASCTLLLAFYALLIPGWEVLGAAVATALCCAIWVGTSGGLLWRRYRLRTDLFGLLWPRAPSARRQAVADPT